MRSRLTRHCLNICLNTFSDTDTTMATKTKDLKEKLRYKFRFSEDENRSSDHIWFKLQLPGIPVISTKVSHGAHEISAPLESLIAKQLGVERKYLLEMIACTKSKEDYEAWIRAHPRPPARYMR